MGQAEDWVLLAYRLPRVPSTPRSAVWRKLKRLGVAQLGDGLVALPADPRTREQLEWIAEEVTDHGGEATLWLGRPLDTSKNFLRYSKIDAQPGDLTFTSGHPGRPPGTTSYSFTGFVMLTVRMVARRLTANWSPRRRRVAPVMSSRDFRYLLAPCTRLAKLTVFPAGPYLNLRLLPVLPT